MSDIQLNYFLFNCSMCVG